jgi:hypothetical protein
MQVLAEFTAFLLFNFLFIYNFYQVRVLLWYFLTCICYILNIFTLYYFLILPPSNPSYFDFEISNFNGLHYDLFICVCNLFLLYSNTHTPSLFPLPLHTGNPPQYSLFYVHVPHFFIYIMRKNIMHLSLWVCLISFNMISSSIIISFFYGWIIVHSAFSFSIAWLLWIVLQ